MEPGSLNIGGWTLGMTPRVVGTVSTAEALRGIAEGLAPPPCDVVEVRFDSMDLDPQAALDLCERVERAGTPVLFTVRAADEGGAWTAPEAERGPLLADALDRLAAVDIELSSTLAADLVGRAGAAGKVVVVSHHDFEGCPRAAMLAHLLKEARALGPAAVPKLAVMVREPTELLRLVRLLEGADQRPVCVIGMGPLGMRTRSALPVLGACLAYGYLDRPAAPGQVPAAALADHFRAVIPEYAAEHGADPDQTFA